MKCPLSDEERVAAHKEAEIAWNKQGWPEDAMAFEIKRMRRKVHDSFIATAAYRKALEECANLVTTYPERIAKWNEVQKPNASDKGCCADLAAEIRALTPETEQQ